MKFEILFAMAPMFALVLAFLTACGPVNVDAKGNGAVPATAATTDTKKEADAATTPATEEPKADDTPAADTPAATATATVSCAAPKAAPKPQAKGPGHTQLMQFRYEMKTWSDANTSAPAGFRLATRAEALELVDAGLIGTEKYTSAGFMVWTSTPDRTARAGQASKHFALDQRDDTMVLLDDDDSQLPAVYVDGPW